MGSSQSLPSVPEPKSIEQLFRDMENSFTNQIPNMMKDGILNPVTDFVQNTTNNIQNNINSLPDRMKNDLINSIYNPLKDQSLQLGNKVDASIQQTVNGLNDISRSMYIIRDQTLNASDAAKAMSFQLSNQVNSLPKLLTDQSSLLTNQIQGIQSTFKTELNSGFNLINNQTTSITKAVTLQSDILKNIPLDIIRTINDQGINMKGIIEKGSVDVIGKINSLPASLKNEIVNPLTTQLDIIRNQSSLLTNNINSGFTTINDQTTSITKAVTLQSDILKNIPLDIIRTINDQGLNMKGLIEKGSVDVIGKINSLPASLKTEIVNPLTSQLDVIRNQSSLLTNNINTGFNQIKDQSVSLSNQINIQADVLKNLPEQLRNDILKFITEQGSATKQIIDKSTLDITSKVNTISNTLTSLPTTLKNEIANPLLFQIDQLKTQSNNIINTSVAGFNDIKNQYNGLQSTVTNTFTAIPTILKESISPLTLQIDQLKKQSLDLPNNLKGVILDPILIQIENAQRLSQTISGQSNDIINRISNIPTIINDQTKFVVNKIDSLPGLLVDNIKVQTSFLEKQINEAFNPLTQNLALATNTLKTIPSYIDDGNKLLQSNISSLEKLIIDKMKFIEDNIKEQAGVIERGFMDKALPVLKNVGDVLKLIVDKSLDLFSMPTDLLTALGNMLSNPGIILAIGGVGALVLLNDK